MARPYLGTFLFHLQVKLSVEVSQRVQCVICMFCHVCFAHYDRQNPPVAPYDESLSFIGERRHPFNPKLLRQNPVRIRQERNV